MRILERFGNLLRKIEEASTPSDLDDRHNPQQQLSNNGAGNIAKADVKQMERFLSRFCLYPYCFPRIYRAIFSSNKKKRHLYIQIDHRTYRTFHISAVLNESVDGSIRLMIHTKLLRIVAKRAFNVYFSWINFFSQRECQRRLSSYNFPTAVF